MNPQILLNNILKNNQLLQNPMFNNAMQMFQKNDEKGLQELAEKIAKEKGTNITDIRTRLGI